MLPRWHILFGAIFSIIVWIAVPTIDYLYIIFIFLSSFLIDFDHYICSAFKTKKLGLFHSFEYHKDMDRQAKADLAKGIKEKGDFHIFHTIEFHILVGLFGLISTPFFYIFLGMIFHSLLDIYSLLYEKEMYKREFFLAAWLWNNLR